jgi:hypothetical protein
MNERSVFNGRCSPMPWITTTAWRIAIALLEPVGRSPVSDILNSRYGEFMEFSAKTASR